MRRKLILKNFFSPGDIVMLTAAVRDLHQCYPKRFVTDVRTPCQAIWENNPYVTPLDEADPSVEVIHCTYPLIDRCNSLPYHCLHGFIQFLNRRLNLNIRPTAFKGDIHISRREKSWFSQVHELTGADIPFWIIVAGGKYDVTIKWWAAERFQQVVDHFRGRIQFVQVGRLGHFHPKLSGVIDLRGRTDLRQLIRLVYHAQGVLCPVTALMHFAAAVETRDPAVPHRPCVVIAGGREPAHWEAYPNHQFIHTLGALRCCRSGGCWRDRVVPLGDGDERDQTGSLCVDVVDHLPRCMDMITAAEVIRRIEHYFDGGALRYLSASEANAAERGIEATQDNPFDRAPLTIQSARSRSELYFRSLPEYPGTFRERGIVIPAGGVVYFTNAWVCIHRLRDLGCQLPIQLWFLGEEELDADMKALVAPLGVECIDATQVREKHPARILNGWELKPYALLHSPFQEVLLLDADNVPVINPEFLFDTPEFKAAGAVFWPDYPRREPPPEVWRFCGIPYRRESPFETGQILIDKERCWRALNLCMWYNENSDFFYRHVHGDKETFHLAFRKAGIEFAMPRRGIHSLEGAMCQHDLRGRRIFQHRNTNKWNLFLTNPPIRGFRDEAACRAHLRRLQQLWDGRMSHFRARYPSTALDAARNRSGNGELRISACMISCSERDAVREQTLKRLAATDWGSRPVHVQMDRAKFKDRVRRITDTAYLALARAVRSGADYILFLEDDLEFNQFLWHNLQCWPPLRTRQVALAGLYNPTLQQLACDVASHTAIMDPLAVYGSQALLISNRFLKFVVNHWRDIDAPIDLKLPRLAHASGRPVYYHAPSLVQHLPVRSTWGGRLHAAGDFCATWRNPSRLVARSAPRA